MICLTKDSACLHFQKFINDPPHLSVNLIGSLFLRCTCCVVGFLTVEATDLNKCLSIMNATLKPWKLAKAVIYSRAMLTTAVREAGEGWTEVHIHYWLVAEGLDFFLSSTLSLASAHSLLRGQGGGQWPEYECSPEVAKNKTTVNYSSK